MKSNRVLLIGYVGKDLSATLTSNGSKRIGLRVATHNPVKNQQDEIKWQTVWHDVVAWNNTAEYAEKTFVKGSKIMVEGMVDYRVFKGREGNTVYRTQIKATSLMNLDR